MLRQLARLSRAVPAISPRAVAIAVYADAKGEPIVAAQSGIEGVACIDDAARALEMYGDLWRATKLPWVSDWCRGLLDFVLAMQEPDGKWVNFILDWDGTKNTSGRTSLPGGEFWQARAMLALARTADIIDDDRIDQAITKGLPMLLEHPATPDVRSLHILTALALSNGVHERVMRERLPAWCDELLACRDDVIFKNWDMEVGPPHLWGHAQEGALASASTYLDRPDLLEDARLSAETLYPDIIRGGFNEASTLPYDVWTTVDAMDRLSLATGQSLYDERASLARAWFYGRNTANTPVYDRKIGRVHDGIDEARLNENSGAESNIVGAQALLSNVADTVGDFALEEVVMPTTKGISRRLRSVS
jgi:hypothetical protein